MSVTCSEYEHIVRKHTTMVCKHLKKNDWYQVMGHLEKCALESNAAIAQIGIRPKYLNMIMHQFFY